MKQLLLLLTIVAFLFVGCKKDEDASANGGKTILKYEIIFPVPTMSRSALKDSGISTTGGMNPVFIYTDGSGPLGLVTDYYDYSYTVWTKEIDVTNVKKPFAATLDTRSYVTVLTGKAYLNIYVNGELKAQYVYKVYPIEDRFGIIDMAFSGFVYPLQYIIN